MARHGNRDDDEDFDRLITPGSLQNRKVDGATDPPSPAPRAEPLHDRLARARALRPESTVACVACWTQGRDAAIKAAKGTSLEAARTVLPAARDWQHHLPTWGAGRDAVVRVLDAG